VESTHRRGLRLPQSGLRSTRGEYIEREGKSGIYALQIALSPRCVALCGLFLSLPGLRGRGGCRWGWADQAINGKRSIPYQWNRPTNPEGERDKTREREGERARESARERSRDGRRFGSASTHDLPQTTGPPTSPSQRSEAKRCKELPSPGSNGPRACKAAKQDEITQTRQRSVSSRWDAQVEQ
jgi:hypothetical protein